MDLPIFVLPEVKLSKEVGMCGQQEVTVWFTGSVMGIILEIRDRIITEKSILLEHVKHTMHSKQKNVVLAK